MTHTPGPWELHHQPQHLMAGDCDWSLQTDAAGAFLLFCHHPEAPAKANARLIVAAPDMAEAIWQALDDMQDSHCVCEATKQQLRAALDKAETPQER